MTNIRSLDVFNPRAQRNGDTIRILTDLLARAQTGEIQEIAIAWVNSSDHTSTVRSCCDDLARMLGAITMLQYNLAQQIADCATPVEYIEDDPA